METSPFDFINSITLSKEDLIKNGTAEEKEYDPYMVNKGLSYFLDTVMHANEMNKLYHLPKYMQYRYLLGAVTKRKRYSKWLKKEERSEDFVLIQKHYQLNDERTLEYMKILTPEQILDIKNKNVKGGRL